jgi:poly(hydroxyalkanoate) depolymerase family esterase
MNDSMRTGLAEATRLTRAGRLTEATAIIQRTLRGMLAPETSSTITDPESVDAAFRVVDEVSLPTVVSAQRPEHHARIFEEATLPPPDVAISPPQDKSTSADHTDTRLGLGEDQDSGTLSPGLHTRETKRTDSTHPRGLRGLLASVRHSALPLSDLSGPASKSMLARARSDIFAGGKFIKGSYTNQAGSRAYKLYIPRGYCGQALPLVIMLHGCTQNPDDFAAGTRMNVLAEKEGFFVVYPAQAPPANQSKCWNWFKTTDQHRGRGEPSIIAGITRQIVNTYHLNAQQVYVAGLSAGGAMAMIMGVCYPDLYAAIGVHSGLAYASAHDLPSAFAAMQHGETNARQWNSRSPAAGIGNRVVPTIVFHGDRDTTVHPRNGDHVLTQWMAINTRSAPGTSLRVIANHGQVRDGHVYTRFIYHDAGGHVVMEKWLVHGAGHAWSGGSAHGSFTDPKGPDASREMVRFFNKHTVTVFS